jgi:hypothetical protein
MHWRDGQIDDGMDGRKGSFHPDVLYYMSFFRVEDGLILPCTDHVQFGLHNWAREFWWSSVGHDNQHEIILTGLRMPITWRCVSLPVKNIPPTGCFYNLSEVV